MKFFLIRPMPLPYRPHVIVFTTKLLNAIENDPNIGIVPLTETLYAQAFNLYQNRADKEWGLVDCVSFVVMQERDISKALTTDEHFRQAGFFPLLQV